MNQCHGHFLISKPLIPERSPGWYHLSFYALIAISIFLQYPVPAQDKQELLKSAMEYFRNEQFHTAAQYYQVAAGLQPENPEICYQLAECYRAVFDYSMAANYYEKAMELDESSFPLASFYQAQMQKSIGNFKNARDGFERFIETNRNNSLNITFIKQAEIETEGSIWAIEQLGKSWRDMGFRIMPEPVNSIFNDYAATTDNAETITITSGRKGVRGSLVDNRFGDYFTDNFRYRKQDDQWVRESIPDHFERTNTKFSDGVGTYNATGDKYYFTSCYEGSAFCKLYVTYRENGEWKNPRLLNENVNTPGYDNKHPALTPGGDTLIFVSNRPGGPGGNDLWFSVSKDGENWETPQPLPGSINTPFNEASPFYYGDNLLFFSSDGHAGIGSMDIFMAREYNSRQNTIQNLGTPFNSGFDDSFFSLGQGIGFLSSNRPGGRGKFDIYAFNLPEQDENMAQYLQETAEGTHLRSRVRNNDGSNLYAVRDEDQFYYDNLSEEERQRLDRIFSHKQNSPDNFDPSTLSGDDYNYYKKLDISTKATIERLAVKRLQEPDNNLSISQMTLQEKLDWEFYHNVDDDERAVIDRIIDLRVEARRRAFSNLTQDEQLYLDNPANQHRIESKLQLRTINSLAGIHQQEFPPSDVIEPQTPELKEQLEQYIQELEPAPDPELEGKIVESYHAQSELLLPLLTPRESYYFKSLDPGRKLRIERLARLVEIQTRDYLIQPETSSDKDYLAYQLASDQWYYKGLSAEEQEMVDELVAQGRNLVEPYNADQQEFIADLSPGEKERLDRMMGGHGKSISAALPAPELVVQEPDREQQVFLRPTNYPGICIYFDFNRYTLREESKKALKDLIRFLEQQDQPVRILVEGHADDIGSSIHNDRLSAQRSQATAAFLEPSSDLVEVVIRSFGEKRPASNNKTAVGRQLNRRVELKIQGIPYQSPFQTFLVKPDITIEMIQEATGLHRQDIIEWNGLSSGNLQPYQLLRLPADIDNNAVSHLLYPTPKPSNYLKAIPAGLK